MTRLLTSAAVIVIVAVATSLVPGGNAQPPANACQAEKEGKGYETVSCDYFCVPNGTAWIAILGGATGSPTFVQGTSDCAELGCKFLVACTDIGLTGNGNPQATCTGSVAALWYAKSIVLTSCASTGCEDDCQCPPSICPDPALLNAPTGIVWDVIALAVDTTMEPAFEAGDQLCYDKVGEKLCAILDGTSISMFFGSDLPGMVAVRCEEGDCYRVA